MHSALSEQVATLCLSHLANIALHLIHTYVQTHAYTPITDVCTKAHRHIWLLFNITSTVKTLGLGKFGKQPAEK